MPKRAVSRLGHWIRSFGATIGDGAIPAAGSPSPAVPAEFHLLREFNAAFSRGPRPIGLFFGDSVFLRVATDDHCDQSLAAMLKARYQEHGLIVADSGYHTVVFERFAALLPRLPMRPAFAVLPINLRSFSPTWDLNPLYQFGTELSLLDSFDPAVPSFRLPGQLAPELNPASVRLAGPPGQEITLRDFFNVARSQYDPKAPGWAARVAQIFHYHYALPIQGSHRKLAALLKTISTLRGQGISVYCYVTPINHQAGTEYCGTKFVDAVRANVETIRREVESLYHSSPSADLHFDDFSLEFGRDEFFTAHNATEHLRSGGRRFLAEAIDDAWLGASDDLGSAAMTSIMTKPMTDTTTQSNAFGDCLPPISPAGLFVRRRSLIKQFSAVVEAYPQLSAYYEGVLQQMSSEAKAVLIIRLARWLASQPEAFSAELDRQYASGELLKAFEANLAAWTQEETLAALARNSRIREVYPGELFPGIGAVSVPVGVIHQESHHANHTDMVYVCAMAALAGARRIFEFGTYRGQTTCGLAAVCPEAQIFTLNLPPEADPRYAPFIGRFIGESPHRGRISQLFADSRQLDTGPYRQSMDYIFIDGDHSYEGVRNDTAKALEMLKPGGMIVWHDYAAKSPGVLRFLAEFSLERPLFRLRKTCIAVYLEGVEAANAALAPMASSLERMEYGDDLE